MDNTTRNWHNCLILLCTVISLCTAQNLKPGYCPITDVPNGARQCNNNDYDCQGSQKCCQVGSTSFSYCAEAVSQNQWPNKPGSCPSSVNWSWNTRTCISDSQCPSSQKCCPGLNGGSYCSAAAGTGLVSTKPGVCPSVSLAAGTCVYECTSDFSCYGFTKCCSNGCGRVCLNPADGTTAGGSKQGNCPPYSSSSTQGGTTLQCNRDYDCFGNLKCCRNIYTNVCLTPYGVSILTG